jgi:hypothetical protein
LVDDLPSINILQSLDPIGTVVSEEQIVLLIRNKNCCDGHFIRSKFMKTFCIGHSKHSFQQSGAYNVREVSFPGTTWSTWAILVSDWLNIFKKKSSKSTFLESDEQ